MKDSTVLRRHVRNGRRPFDQLTPRGQARRLREVAVIAAGRFGVVPDRLTLVAASFNTVFRVEARGISPFVLRVSPEVRIHPLGTECLEAAWTDEILRDTELPVAALRRALDGSVVTTVEVPDVPGRRTCVAFDWVPGQPLRTRADPDRMRRAGMMLAELHDQAEARHDRAVPRGAMVADRVLPFDGDDLLTECPPSHGSLVDDARGSAQRVLDAIWDRPPQAPHLLHGDFTWNNLLASRDQITIIDFQDVMWGFDVIDVVNAVSPLDRIDGSRPLGDAFRDGYAQVRPWPVDDVEVFGALIAARRLTMLNLGLITRKPGLDDHIERHTTALRHWLDHGPDAEFGSRFTA